MNQFCGQAADFRYGAMRARDPHARDDGHTSPVSAPLDRFSPAARCCSSWPARWSPSTAGRRSPLRSAPGRAPARRRRRTAAGIAGRSSPGSRCSARPTGRRRRRGALAVARAVRRGWRPGASGLRPAPQPGAAPCGAPGARARSAPGAPGTGSGCCRRLGRERDGHPHRGTGSGQAPDRAVPSRSRPAARASAQEAGKGVTVVRTRRRP